jgi:hypothetical protein
MLMATSPWASLATVTGRAREDILVSNVAPPCWSLTRTGRDASPLPLKTAKFPPQENRQPTGGTTEAGTALRGQPIRGGGEEGGGSSRDNLRKSEDNLKKIGDNLNLNSEMKIFVLSDRRWNSPNRNNYLSVSPEGPFLLTIKSN